MGGLNQFEFLVGLIDEICGCLCHCDGGSVIKILEPECFAVLLTVDQSGSLEVGDIGFEEVACCSLNLR